MAEEHEDSYDGRMESGEVGDRFEDVINYSMTPEGAIDLERIDRLEGRFGYNGDKPCDVRRGPCSCGAWH